MGNAGTVVGENKSDLRVNTLTEIAKIAGIARIFD